MRASQNTSVVHISLAVYCYYEQINSNEMFSLKARISLSERWMDSFRLRGLHPGHWHDVNDATSSTWRRVRDVRLMTSRTWRHWPYEINMTSRIWPDWPDVTNLTSQTWRRDVIDQTPRIWLHWPEITDLTSLTWGHVLDVIDVTSRIGRHWSNVTDLKSSNWRHWPDVIDITWRHWRDVAGEYVIQLSGHWVCTLCNKSPLICNTRIMA